MFAVNTIPGTEIEQLFFYDPDGNGVEIGNLDIYKLLLATYEPQWMNEDSF